MHNWENASILRLIPPNLAKDKKVIMACKAFDEELHKIIAKIPNVSILPNIDSIIDSALLDLLAWQFHVDFYDRGMPIKTKRELVKKSLDWHTRKGTPSAVEEVVAAVFDDGVVSEWFEYGADPYYFRVTTYNALSDANAAENLVRAIYSVKNTRSWLDGIYSLTEANARYYIGTGVFIDDDMYIRTAYPLECEANVTAYVGAFPYIRGEFTAFSSRNVPVQVQNGEKYIGLYMSNFEVEIEV